MLIIASPHERALSKTAQRQTWEAFMKGGTNHSANAATLPFILRKCEREGIEYSLHAAPGVGYFVKPMTQYVDKRITARPQNLRGKCHD